LCPHRSQNRQSRLSGQSPPQSLELQRRNSYRHCRRSPPPPHSLLAVKELQHRSLPSTMPQLSGLPLRLRRHVRRHLRLRLRTELPLLSSPRLHLHRCRRPLRLLPQRSRQSPFINPWNRLLRLILPAPPRHRLRHPMVAAPSLRILMMKMCLLFLSVQDLHIVLSRKILNETLRRLRIRARVRRRRLPARIRLQVRVRLRIRLLDPLPRL